MDRAEREYSQLVDRAKSIGNDAAIDEAVAKAAAENRLALVALGLVGCMVGLLAGFGVALLAPPATAPLALGGCAAGGIGLPVWRSPHLTRRCVQLRKDVGDALAGLSGTAAHG